MYHANTIGGVAARLAGNRAVIWNIRASALDPHEKLLTRLLARHTGSLASFLCRCIITNSSVAVREHVRHGYPERLFQVIPNGFDLEQFRPDPEGAAILRRELRIPTEAPVVGMIARFHPVKDHACFVRAARMLSDRIGAAHFILAGDGVDDDNLPLRDQLARAGLLANTHLLGAQNDLARVLSAMDVFALSSARGEGFPNVLAEAMACEVPCVATDSGDSGYVVGDAGSIVSPGDAQAMSRAWEVILDMSDQDRRAMGRKGRRRIESRFSLDAIARAYDLVYSECAGRA
jgi:glycosyltransferase involved in cell wall biosynthesis